MDIPAAKTHIKGRLSPVIEQLDRQYKIMDFRVAQRVIDCLVKQHAKHQDWSNDRLLDVVASKFKLKKR